MSPLESVGIASEFRCTRRRVQDLELRLGLSKSAVLSSSRNPGQPVTIFVEDDDDDVRISSPRSVAQARSSAYSRGNRPVHIPILDDEDLELRLGLTGVVPAVARPEPTLARQEPSVNFCLPDLHGVDFGLSLSAAIDLTHANDEMEVKDWTGGKRKQRQPTPEIVKEPKLTCAICMDTMKEETSTVCGHIFCKKCITTAMKAQKKCPTCRRKLANSQIHRIYIPGSTS